jgi:hypothetical protein
MGGATEAVGHAGEAGVGHCVQEEVVRARSLRQNPTADDSCQSDAAVRVEGRERPQWVDLSRSQRQLYGH